MTLEGAAVERRASQGPEAAVGGVTAAVTGEQFLVVSRDGGVALSNGDRYEKHT
ncbi:UNVERIFIED_CONTAM: hypothetical protein Sradi_1232400 [Sesamum radiatum]|uniref:Uncharacterized protein n=1 Tax=Sesamum radiatum TaxID=300843 RepID=A0AAW2UMF6_SESRA